MTDPIPPAARRVIAVRSGGRDVFPEWVAGFTEKNPAFEVLYWDDAIETPDRIDYCVVWRPPAGALARMGKLRLIFSAAAGIDHILADPLLPPHCGIVRTVVPESAQMMGEYVSLAVLSLLRDLRRIVTAQAEARWDNFEVNRSAWETRVAMLGLGTLGRRAAEMLRALGFQVTGWSRSPKDIPGIPCHAGMDSLPDVLRAADIVVCLLPDTPLTHHLLNASRLALLPRGAGLVNAGRGGLVVTDDLLAALDSGHLSGAFLDVADTEPLPADHPIWHHPRVIQSPHLAALASRRARAHFIADNIGAFEAGRPVPTLYDAARGY
jgi:glyoxylate/hydroxypyruvate reductase A